MLRHIGIDPPKWHDVGELLLMHKERFPYEIHDSLGELAGISRWLKEERELAFYGDVDFIPTEEYTSEDAERAMNSAKKVVEVALKVVRI